MDKKRSLLNVIAAIFFKIVILILGIIVRRAVINYIGNDANGLASLYSSIIGILSLAELGVGTAITFSMYKPIIEENNEKVSALYNAFKKFYLVIFSVILGAGILIMPFLSILTKDYSISSNIYIDYILILLSVVMTYFYSAKTSLINAYKNNYITTAIYSIGFIGELIVQLLVVVVYHSLELYFAAKILNTLIQWILTEIICRKTYPHLINTVNKIDNDDKKEIYKNSKALFIHKIGGVLVNTVDSVVISAFIGVAVLGKYTNYTTIVVAMTGVISLFFSPLTSIVGHLCAKGEKEKIEKYYNFFFTFNFAIGVIFFMGYYAVITDLIPICFGNGNDLIMDKSVPIIITINYFVQFMRQSTILFRDASGLFYQDRWKPLIEGIVNVILSILFVKTFPDGYQVLGVIVATIITNLLICHLVEPYVLYKYTFKKSPKKQFLKLYSFVAIFTMMLFVLDLLMKHYDSYWIELIINGVMSVGISIVPIIIIFIVDKNFRSETKDLFALVIRKIKKRAN